jgi:hypothetical protein
MLLITLIYLFLQVILTDDTMYRIIINDCPIAVGDVVECAASLKK